MKRIAGAAVLFSGLVLPATAMPPDVLNRLDAYNVVWDSPSPNALGSMPLGNGDVGLNVWAEPSGDILFYISKTDSWSEFGRLVKIGKVRLTLTPNPLKPFAQTLSLRSGMVRIVIGQSPRQIEVSLWVEARTPAIYVQTKGTIAHSVRIAAEPWRTEEKALSEREKKSLHGLEDWPGPIMVYPDTIASARGRLVWHHRNRSSIWEATLRQQGLESLLGRLKDPLAERTYGAAAEGPDLVLDGKTALRSAKTRLSHEARIHVLTIPSGTTEEWLGRMEAMIARSRVASAAAAQKAQVAWWKTFWERSWIFVEGSAEAEVVSRGYVLQRFILACSCRGAYPPKFNGSIFNVDNVTADAPFDADYRRWDSAYWFQNTRLIYWPMLAAGDDDLMEPLFKMYLEALPLAKERTRVYYGHDGAYYPETMYFWGVYCPRDFGWDRTGRSVSEVVNPYIRHHLNNGLEIVALMLDLYAYTKDKTFLCDTLLPFAREIMLFYDKHYSRDSRGLIRIYPSQALETYQDAANPAPDVAGLIWDLDGLLALPQADLDPAWRASWEALRRAVPPLPIQDSNIERELLYAEEVRSKARNIENPELYSIFPFRIFGVDKPDLALARKAFSRRAFPNPRGWGQDDIQAAFLGLAAEARKILVARFGAKHEASRFPAFWGPNYDWVPDQDHGANGMKALQTMLLQADGGKIILFPAWPKDWDVAFKLSAPDNTAVEAVLRGGRLESLNVTPQARRADVIIKDRQ
jgi:hypothetical protein